MFLDRQVEEVRGGEVIQHPRKVIVSVGNDVHTIWEMIFTLLKEHEFENVFSCI